MLTRQYNYAYDLMGNRTRAETVISGQVSAVNYQYNLANQLTTSNYSTAGAGLPDYSTTYTYDPSGNLMQYGNTTLLYDAENRLTHALNTQNPSLSTVYSYNGYGDRYSQQVGNQTTTYLLDYNTDLTQVLAETTSGQTTSYLPGVGQQQGTNWTYYTSDGLGSTRQLLNKNGDVTYAASYEPYGAPFEQHQPGLKPTFTFTGEQQDANGLIYLRARYYDPKLGTFVSKDPFGGTATRSITQNPYIYAGANPVNYVDPSGRCFGFLGGVDTIICTVLIAGGIGLAVGAVTGTAFSAISQYYETGRIDFKKLATDAAIGGVLGLASGVAFGATMFAGAYLGATLFGLSNISGLAASAWGVGTVFAAGVVSGQVTRALDNIVYSRPWI